MLGLTASSKMVSQAYVFVMVAGASPLFPPRCSTAEQARAELLDVVARSPRLYGFEQTRWTLVALRASCVWLVALSLGGVHTVLRRLAIHWKRGRSAVRSPDPAYHPKRDDIAKCVHQAQATPEQVVTLYLDEVTIQRQPSVSYDYDEAGDEQPRAKRSWSADTQTRIVATLEHTTGRVVFQRARVTTSALVGFFQKLCTAYPHATRINVVLDNWPVHYHPDVLVALEKQHTVWPLRCPGNWPTAPSAAAVRKWGQLQLPIQFVPLPTYASWLNPIEKLWRKLRQDLTHHHPFADDLPQLRDELDRFLSQFALGSPELLRYVGLGLPH
jgi:transposase